MELAKYIYTYVCVCVLQGTFDPTGPFLFSERADALTACAQFALRCLHTPPAIYTYMYIHMYI